MRSRTISGLFSSPKRTPIDKVNDGYSTITGKELTDVKVAFKEQEKRSPDHMTLINRRLVDINTRLNKKLEELEARPTKQFFKTKTALLNAKNNLVNECKSTIDKLSIRFNHDGEVVIVNSDDIKLIENEYKRLIDGCCLTKKK